MRIFDLQTVEGELIPLSYLRADEGKVLLECFCPDLLMNYLYQSKKTTRYISGTYTRGVFFPGEGLIFEFFNEFGQIYTKPVKFSEQESYDLLLSKIW